MDNAAEVMTRVFRFRREAICLTCEEIVRLDVDPAGRLLAILSDDAFASLTEADICRIKDVCYGYVREFDREGLISPQAFRMRFDSVGSYNEFGSSYYYYLSDNTSHQIEA